MYTIQNIQLEPTQGCTRLCEYCGLNQITDKSLKFMTMETFTRICSEIKGFCKPKIRIDFAVHGEPLANKNLPAMVKLLRSEVPLSQISVITNGDLLTFDLLKSLFESGLNYIHLDFHNSSEEKKVKIYEVLKSYSVPLLDFYVDKFNIWGYHGSNEKAIVVCDDASNTYSKITREIHTAGGNLPRHLWEKYGISEDNLPYQHRCNKPFKELTINYDGNIPLCCEDWRGQCSVGNIMNSSLEEIWLSPKMNVYREFLYSKRRDLINLCRFCNERSFRTGFLKLEHKTEG